MLAVTLTWKFQNSLHISWNTLILCILTQFSRHLLAVCVKSSGRLSPLSAMRLQSLEMAMVGTGESAANWGEDEERFPIP